MSVIMNAVTSVYIPAMRHLALIPKDNGHVYGMIQQTAVMLLLIAAVSAAKIGDLVKTMGITAGQDNWKAFARGEEQTCSAKFLLLKIIFIKTQ